MKKYLAFAAVATMFAACTNEEVTQAESLKDTPITIASAGVGELTASRTTTDDVVNNPFGLFVESTSDDTKYEAANMKWTYNNGWESDETLLFEGAGKQTAYAYHPYTENATANYTFTTNGTTDLLWWKSESTLTGNSLDIEFSHALSKLTVNLKKNSEVGTADLGDVTIGGTVLTGTANLAEQTWTLDENAVASNIATTATAAASGYDKTVEVLLLPQTATFSVMIAAGEKTYVWTSAGQTFVSGKAYTLNLTVGKDVTAVTEVRVAGWNEETINGGMATKLLGDKTDATKAVIGDVALTDGSFVSKDNIGSMTPEQKDAMAGIVFWTVAETAPTGRTYPASLTDDKVMNADFPHCTHGLIVSLTNLQMTWSNEEESVNDVFQNNSNDYNPSTTNYAGIEQNKDYDQFYQILGYQNTEILKAYNEHCEASGKAAYKVNPITELNSFILTNPAPLGSTGWYLPSEKELTMICYDDVDKIIDNTGIKGKQYLNSIMSQLGTDLFVDDSYWSSTELGEQYACGCDFENGTFTSYRKKFYNVYVRYVCAF